MLHSGRLRVVSATTEKVNNQWTPDILVCSLEYRVIAKDNWRENLQYVSLTELSPNDFPWTTHPWYFPSPGWCVHDRCVRIQAVDSHNSYSRKIGIPGRPVDHQATRTHRPRKNVEGHLCSRWRSRIHERTISSRFLGITLGVLRLEVSVWIS